MNQIVKKYIKILTNLNYSERTIETYSCYLEKFLQEINTNPYQVTTKQIKNYLLNKEFSSTSQQNQYIGSLKLFAKHLMGKKDVHLSKIKRPKRKKKLPRVVDAELLLDKILKIENKKHRLILLLGLSCGLRVSEVINLKRKDIDIKRMVIHVRNGKGGKDRAVKLTEKVLEYIMEYGFEFKPSVYLFNGQKSPQYSQGSIQKIIKKHINKNESYHLLRHAYGTYAIDCGTELKPLSVTMGHSSTRTVEQFYYHQSQRTLNTIKQVI